VTNSLSYFMGCVWFDVCWCYVAVWLWWCGIRMQAEALVPQPVYGLFLLNYQDDARSNKHKIYPQTLDL